MTHYHLNQHRGPTFIADIEGADFRGLSEARLEAVASIREIISETVSAGFIDMSWYFEIADDAGIVLASVLFRDAVDLRS